MLSIKHLAQCLALSKGSVKGNTVIVVIFT